MKLRTTGPAEGCLPLPGAAGTAPLTQEAANNKKQEQPPQAPYQSQEGPQQRIHLGPFRCLVKPRRYQEPPRREKHTEYGSDGKQRAFHRQGRLCDAKGIIPAFPIPILPIAEVTLPESFNLVYLLYGRSDLGDLRLK